MAKKTTRTKYRGDCSLRGIANEAVKVYKMSNAKNPIKTGNALLDFVVNKNKYARVWNTGFNVGKLGFIAGQTYKNTCKRKK